MIDRLQSFLDAWSPWRLRCERINMFARANQAIDDADYRSQLADEARARSVAAEAKAERAKERFEDRARKANRRVAEIVGEATSSYAEIAKEFGISTDLVADYFLTPTTDEERTRKAHARKTIGGLVRGGRARLRDLDNVTGNFNVGHVGGEAKFQVQREVVRSIRGTIAAAVANGREYMKTTTDPQVWELANIYEGLTAETDQPRKIHKPKKGTKK